MKKVPIFKSDEEAADFLEQDLSDLDFSQFKSAKFEFMPKSERVNMRFPTELLDAVRAKAAAQGMPYQRFIRAALEEAVAGKK